MGEREIYLIKYEKVPKFCEVCGLLGHEYVECGNGFHKPDALVYGEWLIAEPPRRGRGRGRTGGFAPRGGRAPARGRGRGRGAQAIWRNNDIFQDDETEDQPPCKDGGKSVRKRLEVGDGTEIPTVNAGALVIHEKRDTAMEETDPKVGDIMEEDNTKDVNGESPVKVQDRKRMKTVEDGAEENPNDILAGPVAGCFREQ
ncbi:hypothetical protein QYE76_049597 [Lolium multiflorum]|uniref:Zinc knuckle CX2CX4HX4C domain-containing protein n=1 Tax=Lolium multiflorum TaxID=4521 RepID=A0AAD8SNB4_LOLMU|nr:hypothetical protein QYE76_049597 [Lolium multiflorum]